MIRSILVTASVLALAACNAPEPEKAATEAVPPPVATPDAPLAVVDANALTPDGWGNIRVGMTRAEVEAAEGPDSSPNAVGGTDPAACPPFHPEQARPASRHILGSWVLLPLPVSPMTMSTACSRMPATLPSRRSLPGRAAG